MVAVGKGLSVFVAVISPGEDVAGDCSVRDGVVEGGGAVRLGGSFVSGIFVTGEENVGTTTLLTGVHPKRFDKINTRIDKNRLSFFRWVSINWIIQLMLRNYGQLQAGYSESKTSEFNGRTGRVFSVDGCFQTVRSNTASRDNRY